MKKFLEDRSFLRVDVRCVPSLGDTMEIQFIENYPDSTFNDFL